MSLLELRGLSRRFAGLLAVDGVDLDVASAQVHAIIGPNGAGKTTLFNLISGILPPSAGSIAFDGADITNLPTHQRAPLGITRTFQNIRVFGAMTVLENVLTGAHASLPRNLLSIVAGTGPIRRAEAQAATHARETLAFVGLSNAETTRAAALSYGDRRRLEIARALMPNPKLLLLDEPAAGMNPAETTALATLVRQIRDRGTTILLVEHDMGFVTGLCDAVTVLNFGRRIFSGPPDVMRRTPEVIEAYLGAKVAAKLAANPK
jgi:branched-chain amino acid transport system ATP-binding protein